MLLLEKLEQKRKYIILIMIAFLLVGIICSLFVIPKKITAESTLMLVEKELKSENEFVNKSNLDLTKKMISNFEEIIKSESSIKLVNESLNENISINELKNKIKIKDNSNSDTFKIIVLNDKSNLAVEINEELIKVFSEKVKTIYSNTDVYVVDNAHTEEYINYSSIIITIIICAFLGIAVNVAYLFSLTQIDKIVKKSDDIESELSLKNLGQIPLTKVKNKLVGSSKNFTLAFRNLRSNIQFVNVNNKEKETILITSSRKSEGKTVVASNLAIAFAKAGKKVILVDADMASGKVAQMFNLPNDLGLSNYLSGIDENGVEVNERINKYIKETGIKNLNIVTSGTVPPNPSELLAMPKFKDTIKDLSVFYDILILDSTPVLNETNALVLARIANSTIIVSNYRKTKKDDLWHTKRDIQNVGGTIVGIVINKVRVREDGKKIYIEVKKTIKNIYLLIKDFITKMANRKQKLLNEAKPVEEEVVEEKEPIIVATNTVITDKKENTEQVENQISFDNLENNEEDKTENIEIKKEESEENLEVIQEVETEEIKEEKNSKIKIDTSEIKEKAIFVLSIIKEKTISFAKNAKEKTALVALALKNFISSRVQKVQINIPEVEVPKSEVIDQEEKKSTKKESSKNKKSEEQKDENSVLVIVDAENGFCRAFSQTCFTERYVRGIDKTDGFVKANYSLALNNTKNLGLMAKYEITKKQADRVDPLIYSTLQEYDECVWVERKMSSNKAEEYVLCMTKEYDITPGESKTNYELRCQYLRKVDLAKNQIEVEYKLENAWKSNQITFTDKIVFSKYANAFGSVKNKKNDTEKKNINLNKFDVKKITDFIKKFKPEQVKAKSVEELTKEVDGESEFENYHIDEIKDYSKMSREEREEEQIRREQEEMIRQQIKLKKELKEQKALEKEERRKERNKRRLEQKKTRELRRLKAKEEARIEEEIMVDNLYPKTKYNKNI